MELRHLRYFTMAAEEANISRASSRLNVSQPAVSRQIRDLESELGVTLFVREPRGLRLTEAGEVALCHAREILSSTDAMADALLAFRTSQKKRSLRIAYIVTALPGFLADGLRKFNREHQDMEVQIQEMTPARQEAALQEGEIDLAFLGQPTARMKRRFEIEPIRKAPMAAVVPSDHRLAQRKSIDLVELAGDQVLSLHEDDFPGRPELVEKLFRRRGIRLEVVSKVGGLSEILGQVAGGAGVTVVPADLAVLPHTGAVFLELKRPRMTVVSSAAWRRDHETKELRALVRLLQETAHDS